MKRPRDINQHAKHTVDLATGLIEEPDAEPQGPQLRGVARANALSPQRRSEIARKAAAARWGKRTAAGG